MRFSAFSRRCFVLFSSLSLILLVLAAPIAVADDGPSAPAPQGDLRQRVAVKIDELAKAIDQQIEAQRQAERAQTLLAIFAEAATGGDALDSVDPDLKKYRQDLNAVQIERDIMHDSSGFENPRYKAMAKRFEMMKEAMDKQIEDASTKIEKKLPQLRREAAAAKARLDAATARVDTIKRELLELATGGGK